MMDELTEIRLREDYETCAAVGAGGRPWETIYALMEKDLVKAGLWWDGEEYVGSFGLEIGPDYQREQLRLEVCWLRVRNGSLGMDHINTVCQKLYEVATALGLGEVLVRGRPGWQPFAGMVKAREIERVWRVKLEDLKR